MKSLENMIEDAFVMCTKSNTEEVAADIHILAEKVLNIVDRKMEGFDYSILDHVAITNFILGYLRGKGYEDSIYK